MADAPVGEFEPLYDKSFGSHMDVVIGTSAVSIHLDICGPDAREAVQLQRMIGGILEQGLSFIQHALDIPHPKGDCLSEAFGKDQPAVDEEAKQEEWLKGLKDIPQA